MTLIFAILLAIAVVVVESSKTVIGYYASWQWYDRSGLAKPSNMDFTKVDRVNFAFFQVDSSGNIWGTDDWADSQVLYGPTNWNPPSDAVQKCSWTKATGDKQCNFHKTEEGLIGLAHAAGAEVYPSLGGWTLSDAFPAMAANPTSRAAFADNCVKFIKDYGWDGIDIDWEYPGYKEHSGTENDRENYNLLLDELRSKLDALTATTGKYYAISAALPCGPSNIDNIDVAHVATVLDELNLMTYDFSGSWDNATGVNAPMVYQGWGPDDYSVTDCVNNWLQGGGTKEQINIGLPFYGRSFGSASSLNQPFDGADMTHFRIDEGTPQYFNIVNQPGIISVRHEETKTQYGYFADGSGFVSYDDEQAICDKTEYVIENDLNGFIIWELSGDIMEDLSTPLLDAVNNKLNSPSMKCSEGATPTSTTQSLPPPSNPQTEVQQAPPSSSQTQSNSGTCGNGNVGNGVCPDGTCCSQHGWCGTTDEHCATSPSPPNTVTQSSTDSANLPANDPAPPVGCVANTYGLRKWVNDADCQQCQEKFLNYWPCKIEGKAACTCGGSTGEATSPSPPNVVAPPISSQTQSNSGTCGNGNVGNGVCPDGTCCSQYGWCGTTEEHCDEAPPVPATSPGDVVPPRSGCRANAHGLANWIGNAECQTCQQEFVNYWPCIINGKVACDCSEGEIIEENEPTIAPTRNAGNNPTAIPMRSETAPIPLPNPTPPAPIPLPTLRAPTYPPIAVKPMIPTSPILPPPAPSQRPITTKPTIAASPIAAAPPRPTIPAAGSDDLTAQLLEALISSDGSSILKWKTPQNTWKVSDMYKWSDMITAARMMLIQGVGDLKLWNGGTDIRYGLVGIASFLANAMHEAIQYNACDENNWSDMSVSQNHGGEPYAAVSACGQLGQSYQDYTASDEEDVLAKSTGVGEYAGQGMACTVDPDMELRAHTHSTWYGAPAPLFCAPKSKVPKAPKWNHASPWCAPEGGWGYEPNKFQGGEINQEFFDYVNGGGSCRDYEGIQSGGWEFCNGEGCPGVVAPNFGQEARTDVEGCCWWGRGVIQTTGVANFGKLNYYFGKRASVEGREALFPTVDFCKRPDAICDPNEDPSIKWVAGFFYHLNAVQTYDYRGWNYYDELKKFVDGGMKGDAFINGVSSIVNRGRHDSTTLHAGPERIRNFKTVLRAMGLYDENSI